MLDIDFSDIYSRVTFSDSDNTISNDMTNFDRMNIFYDYITCLIFYGIDV